MNELTLQTLVKRLMACDSARVIELGKNKFLVIGRKAESSNTYKSDENGELKLWIFSYLEEVCIANGNTFSQLWQQAKEYKRISGKI